VTGVLQSYAYLTAEQNQRMSLLKARALAREYSRRQPMHCPQGIFKPDKEILAERDKLE
jgi:hypothetical protein